MCVSLHANLRVRVCVVYLLACLFCACVCGFWDEELVQGTFAVGLRQLELSADLGSLAGEAICFTSKASRQHLLGCSREVLAVT